MARVRFYGVRGSCPCSGPGIARYGGATACVSLELDDGSPPVVLDLGTGSRLLGEELVRRFLGERVLGHAEPNKSEAPPPEELSLSVFITHLHFDHVQGLPFFLPALRESSRIELYAPSERRGELEAAMAAFVRPPLFPVELSLLPGKTTFNEIADGDSVEVGPVTVTAGEIPHRGRTLGYRLASPAGAVAYLSDHQQPLAGAADRIAPGVVALTEGVELLVHDAQYTPDELAVKSEWGHSTPGYAVEVARRAGAKRLVLFHHDPTHTDDFLDRLGEETSRLAGDDLQVVVASEGLELFL